VKASGGKLFAKSLAKNFKSLAFYKHCLIGSRCEHDRAEQGSARAVPMTPKFLGEFENLSFKKGSQEKS